MTTQDAGTHDKTTVRMFGGSTYILIEPSLRELLGIKVENGEIKNSDTTIVRAIGNHGMFAYLYSPSFQKKWTKEQKKRNGL